jgi:hypothetical protein
LSDPIPELTPEEIAKVEAHRAQAAATTLSVYNAITVLMLLGIGGLALYCFKLGPLIGPGVESSFGLAVGAMFLMGAMLAHIADRTYRNWPLGRRFHPSTPGPVTPRGVVSTVTWLVVAAAALCIVYVVAQLLM